VQKTQPKLKIPVEIELPKPDDRKFENFIVERPAQRKIKQLDVKFGDLTEKNVE
jgi:hypothetical protein